MLLFNAGIARAQNDGTIMTNEPTSEAATSVADEEIYPTPDDPYNQPVCNPRHCDLDCCDGENNCATLKSQCKIFETCESYLCLSGCCIDKYTCGEKDECEA